MAQQVCYSLEDALRYGLAPRADIPHPEHVILIDPAAEGVAEPLGDNLIVLPLVQSVAVCHTSAAMNTRMNEV